MPLFNFQKQFAADVESGKKRQTIRSRRKIRPQVGQTAYLYTGARTKACRKLGEDTITDVIDLWITSRGVLFDTAPILHDSLSIEALDEFAKKDGFADWKTMCDWFEKTHGLPFEGDLIKW